MELTRARAWQDPDVAPGAAVRLNYKAPRTRTTVVPGRLALIPIMVRKSPSQIEPRRSHRAGAQDRHVGPHPHGDAWSASQSASC